MVCTPGTVAGTDRTVRPGRRHRVHRHPGRQQRLHVELRDRRRRRTSRAPARCCASPRARPSSSTCTTPCPRRPRSSSRARTASRRAAARRPAHHRGGDRRRRDLHVHRRPARAPTCTRAASDIAKQVEMGLYGALIVRPDARSPTTRTTTQRPSSTPAASTCCCSARSTPTCTTRSRPAALRLQRAAQPLLHDQRPRVPRHHPGQRRPRCCRTSRTARWCGSSRTPPRTAGPALIRMINVGALNHPFHPHGNHTTADRPGRPAASPASDRALRRDHRLRADRGLPAPLGRRRTTGTRPPTRCRWRSPTTAT